MLTVGEYVSVSGDLVSTAPIFLKPTPFSITFFEIGTYDED